MKCFQINFITVNARVPNIMSKAECRNNTFIKDTLRYEYIFSETVSGVWVRGNKTGIKGVTIT